MTAPPHAAGLAKVADAVGAFCLGHFRGLSAIRPETKGPADYVSHVDRAAEMLATAALNRRFPGISVVGEERGGPAADRYWSVDPVDGTANFLSGLPIWAVSIALIEQGHPKLGVIVLPALGMRVMGGCGVPLSVCGEMGAVAGAAIAYGVGRNPGWQPDDRQTLEAHIELRGHHVVCLGSCAASLAFVALGRLAGYAERGVALWDCAAGVAVCRAAGVAASILPGESDGKVDVRAERNPAGPPP